MAAMRLMAMHVFKSAFSASEVAQCLHALARRDNKVKLLSVAREGRDLDLYYSAAAIMTMSWTHA